MVKSRSSRESLFALVALAAVLLPVQGTAATDLAIDAYSPLHVGLVLVVWIFALYALLVAVAEINDKIKSRVWDAMTLGHLLIVLGLVLINASEFAVPRPLYEERLAMVPVALTGIRLLLVLIMVVTALAFFRSWCTVFSLEPDLFAPTNTRYLASAAIITLGSAILPFMWAPPLNVDTVLGPFVTAITTSFILLVAYGGRITGQLLKRIPSFKNLHELMVYYVLMILFVGVYATEAYMMSPHLRLRVFSETFIFVSLGFLCSIIGLGIQVRALAMLNASFGMVSTKGYHREEEGAGEAMVEAICDLAGRFVRTVELEALVNEVKAGNPALRDLSFDARDRCFTAEAIDLEDNDNVEDISLIFNGMVDLLTTLSPPNTDRKYTKERLRKELYRVFGDNTENLPPAVAGFILPRDQVAVQGMEEVFTALFPALPLEAGFRSILIQTLKDIWGDDAVTAAKKGPPIVDVAGTMEQLRKARGRKKAYNELVARYRRTLAEIHFKLKNIMSRDDIKHVLDLNVRPVAERPVFRAAGITELFTNALFASGHPWGFEAIDGPAGHIPAHFSVLLIHSPGFTKEHFYSTFISKNLGLHRHAIWVSQARHTILKRLMERVDSVDDSLAQGRLKLLSVDPNMDTSKELGPGCYLIGATLNTISWELRRAFQSFPVGSVCTVLELPPSALKEDTTMLYKFVSHVKSLCENNDAALVLGVDAKICTTESLAMLRDISEIVVEAESDGQLSITRITGGPPVKAEIGREGQEFK
ncbi:MAG: hypothetical protein QGG50_06435 [Methanopyri archaeon]|nr:hypothetical protein [Methanopyri archaeon]